MSEQLDEDAAYNQPCRLREDIHAGRLKIKQAFVEQHPEHHLAVKIVKERGRERVAEDNQAGRAQIVAMERKINPRLLLALTAKISSCTRPLQLNSQLFVSQDSSICFLPAVV